MGLDPANVTTTERVGIDLDYDTLAAVLADVRQRIADGELSPVLAQHLTALGLDDVVLALAMSAE